MAGQGDERRTRRIRVAAALVVAVLVLVVAIGQLVLPAVAERRVRSELERIGVVSNVEVSSFPALKLLAGEVDSLTAALGRSEATDDEVADLIARARRVDRLRISAPAITVSGLALSDVALRKDADRLAVSATLAQTDLLAFLPPGIEVDRIEADGGDLMLEGSFSAFGVRVSGPARVSASDGAIVLTPLGTTFGGLGAITIFEDERISVDSLSVRAAGPRLRVLAEGRLAG